MQYAARYGNRYRLVWWITADGPERIETQLAALAGHIHPPIALAGTTEQAAHWVLGWLSTHTGWLLILDNVDDSVEVAPLLGRLTRGHILITTRRNVRWGAGIRALRLDLLEEAEAIELITVLTGRDSVEERRAAGDIVKELGYLPLALDQAAAYMQQGHISPSRYLTLLRAQPSQMYEAGPEGGDVQRTIARLWHITLEAIRKRDPAAERTMIALACYAPDNIPRAILGGPGEEVDIDRRLALLASYSMITLTDDIINVHRLTQAALTQHNTPALQAARCIALHWLYNALPENPDSNVVAWPMLRGLVPHLDHLTSCFSSGQEPTALGYALNELALFEQSQGNYDHAYAMRIRALAIVEAALGPEHPGVATVLGNLASSLYDLGRVAEAVLLEERALSITEMALGPDHPDVAICLSNLACGLCDLGRAAEALPLLERALSITESALGPDHPDVAIRLGNLASSLLDLGRAAEALPLEERALSISEMALGPDHPDVAACLGNLACGLCDLGRVAEAVLLEERALSISESALGPDHPDVANRLGNLASSLLDLGRVAEAVLLEERALSISEMALGPDHPDVAIRLGNLASSLYDLGRVAEAVLLEERALSITESALGPDHPDVAICLSNLACGLRDLGRVAEAVLLEERALSISESALGPDHPQ